MFELHDRARFEVFGYSFGPDEPSPFRRRLIESFDFFVDLNDLSHIDAARRIADDGVDILIDLNGYTGKERPRVTALRPGADPGQLSRLSGHDRLDFHGLHSGR